MKNRILQILEYIVFGILGLLSFIFIALNLSFWIIPVVALALIKLAVPV